MNRTWSALTLVVTDRNLSRPSSPEINSISLYERLRGTKQDVSEADRVVYVDPQGIETLVKDRYPKAYIDPDDVVIEFRIARPVFLSYEETFEWIELIRDYRKLLNLNPLN